ncbi:MAG: hypothetical protein GDA45_00090 [Chromatiales bacterium]|nr:hypothetical protein [Chromatiales bacterium]
MDEKALEDQIEEAKVLVATATESVAAHKKMYDEIGAGDDMFSQVLNSDNFTPEFKNIVKEQRERATAKIEEQSKQQTQTAGKSSKIAGHAGVTKI